MKIVLATSNPNKVKEINAIMSGLDVEFIMPPEDFDPVEDADNFEENALLKAKEANRITGLPALADDSGLCVDALGGAPGIYSARYADTPKNRIERLLSELKNIPKGKRSAKFVCAMAMVGKDGKTIFLDSGECHGKIAFEPKGINGFGYDPIFIVNGYDVTMAELPEKEKNKISHRAVVISKFLDFLKNYKLN